MILTISPLQLCPSQVSKMVSYTLYLPIYILYLPNYILYLPIYILYLPNYILYLPNYILYLPIYILYLPNYILYLPIYILHLPLQPTQPLQRFRHLTGHSQKLLGQDKSAYLVQQFPVFVESPEYQTWVLAYYPYDICLCVYHHIATSSSAIILASVRKGTTPAAIPGRGRIAAWFQFALDVNCVAMLSPFISALRAQGRPCVVFPYVTALPHPAPRPLPAGSRREAR